MNFQEQTPDERIPYAALVRGAATFILQSQKNLATKAREIADLYARDPAQGSADLDRIVRAERHKVGGGFEIKEPRAWLEVKPG